MGGHSAVRVANPEVTGGGGQGRVGPASCRGKTLTPPMMPSPYVSRVHSQGTQEPVAPQSLCQMPPATVFTLQARI